MLDLGLFITKRDHLVAGNHMLVQCILGLVVDLLALEGREVGGQAIVVVLLPSVERVVMAFGAGDAHSEKNLSRRFGGDLRVAVGAIERGRWILVRAPETRDELADPLLKRAIRCDLLTEPFML